MSKGPTQLRDRFLELDGIVVSLILVSYAASPVGSVGTARREEGRRVIELYCADAPRVTLRTDTWAALSASYSPRVSTTYEARHIAAARRTTRRSRSRYSWGNSVISRLAPPVLSLTACEMVEMERLSLLACCDKSTLATVAVTVEATWLDSCPTDEEKALHKDRPGQRRATSLGPAQLQSTHFQEFIMGQDGGGANIERGVEVKETSAKLS